MWSFSKSGWVLFPGKKILEPWKSQGLELAPGSLEPSLHVLRPTLHHSRWGVWESDGRQGCGVAHNPKRGEGPR